MSILKTHTLRNLALGTAIVTLAACTEQQRNDSNVGQFYRTAGSELDTGSFGQAVVHNQLVQTCKTNGYGVGKGKGGAAAGDPVVVLDPSSTHSRKVYRVHCDGRLDGKFAAVIYREYIRSARAPTTVTEADSE